MSIGSLGVIGSVTAGQLQQARGADSDRATQESQTHRRQIDAMQRAEAAEGIAKTDQDEAASDRDADGRRLWEPAPEPQDGSEPPAASDLAAPRGVDPTGTSGQTLDLTG